LTYYYYDDTIATDRNKLIKDIRTELPLFKEAR